MLELRERVVKGYNQGLVVPEGLAAHGRGEAFDYLLGCRTTQQARAAAKAASAALLTARHAVISVNGNAVALTGRELVELAKATGAELEVNLYHPSASRKLAIAKRLIELGAEKVLGTQPKFELKIPELHSDRRRVDKRGIATADVVLVPLEDGDRTSALRRLGKFVVAIDLNPLSKTARAANITVVDNIARALPLMVAEAKKLLNLPQPKLKRLVHGFDNQKNLRATIKLMLRRLQKLSKGGR